jgi:hypothetical protein
MEARQDANLLADKEASFRFLYRVAASIKYGD